MEKLTTENGFILYQDDSRLEGAIELHQIFVNEDSRHKGVGEELLKELKKVANGRTIVTYSSTDPERETFGKFLVAEGFVRTNVQNSTGNQWVLEAKATVVDTIKKVLKVKNAKKTKKSK